MRWLRIPGVRLVTVSTVVRKLKAAKFICIITGGIDGTEDGVETRMAEQMPLAIEEAGCSKLFMVDARAGLMPAGEAIAKHLRSRENRPSRWR